MATTRVDQPTVLVSPSDKPLAEKLGDKAITSSLPEQKGADVLIYSRGMSLGLQRKEVPHDFILSVIDGRLARETSLLRTSVWYGAVVCEGKFKYFKDGALVSRAPKDVRRSIYGRFTYSMVQKILLEIQVVKGIDVVFVEEGIESTAAYIEVLLEFLASPKHVGLYRRPGAPGVWGTPTFDEQQSWILQGFPGVGPSLADSILKAFGGRIPAKWMCDYEEFLEVKGIGAGRAKKIYKQLHPRGTV